MSSFYYSKKDKEIFIYSTFESYQFNDTSALIFEKMIAGESQEEIIKAIANEYDVDPRELDADVKDTIAHLISLGISTEKITSFQPENEFEKIAHNFYPHTPIVHIIQNCNSPCKMCDCWLTKQKVFHKASSLKPFFKKMKELGATSIMLSGGEPLLHPELQQIIIDVKIENLQVMLNTNGLLLHKNMWLTQQNIEQVVVSMDGYDPSTYKEVRGLNGHDLVWTNLKNFKRLSPSSKIGIRTILTKRNFNKMDLIIRDVEENGLHSVGMSPADVSSHSFSRERMDNTREDDQISLLLPSEEEIINFLEIFKEGDGYYEKIKKYYERGLCSWGPEEFIQCMLFYLRLHKRKKSFYPNTPCSFPSTSLVLDYNGDLKNCFYSESFGNLYSFQSVDWSFKESVKKLKESQKCTNCRGQVFCGLEKQRL